MDAVVLPSLRIFNIHECEFVLHEGEFMIYYEDLNVLLALAESRSTTRMSVGLWVRVEHDSLRTPRSDHLRPGSSLQKSPHLEAPKVL